MKARKNRRVIRLVPPPPPAPKNERVIDQQSDALDRIMIWLTLALFGCCGITAPICAHFLLGINPRFEVAIIWGVVSGMMAAVGVRETYASWKLVAVTDAKLEKRDAALTLVRSRVADPPDLH